jgi:hypothetical protein
VEIMLKNKCCLYVIISIRFFSIMICNLLIELPLYITMHGPTNVKKVDSSLFLTRFLRVSY